MITSERLADISLMFDHDKPGEPCDVCNGLGQLTYEGPISGEWSETCQECQGAGTNTLDLCERRGRAIGELLAERRTMLAALRILLPTFQALWHWSGTRRVSFDSAVPINLRTALNTARAAITPEIGQMLAKMEVK